MEIERARLTRQLARMHEEEGKVQEAAEILQEVAVVSGARPRMLACMRLRRPRPRRSICITPAASGCC